MTKNELLDILALNQGESAALWATAIDYERINGPLATLVRNAEYSGIGFRISIEQIEKEAPDVPAALYNLGGAHKLDVSLGGDPIAGPSALALAALNTYDIETHETPDTGAGTGAVDVAGTGGPAEAPDTAEGTVI